jgi:hypothetical protein
MKAILIPAIAALLGGCANQPAEAGIVDLSIIDRQTGQQLPVYNHHGKRYVVGVPGHKYAVKLNNRSGGRVLAVTSVDGVNVVSGETASPGQTGYVLGAHFSTDIFGWRKSLDEVAAFYFTALPDSYAARTDRPQNVGVIGVAVFREYTPPARLLSKPSPAPAAEAPDAELGAASRDSSARREKLGTGHGEREASHVEYTNFRRANDTPDEVVTIYYDSYSNLVARGVIPTKHARDPQPNPFPGRFVPDPAS